MPWWNRVVIAPRRATVTFGGAALVLESDPVTLADAWLADEVRGFLDVRWIDSGCKAQIFRYGGPDEGSLKTLDPTVPYAEATAPGITCIEWPVPPPPCILTRVELTRSAAGTGSVEVTVLQTARWG